MKGLESIKRQFALKKPCYNCPFNNNGYAISLQQGRIEGIVDDLTSERHSTFHCHKAVYKDEKTNFDEDGNFVPNDIQQCAGAIAVMKKLGRDTQIVKMAERMGIIEPDHYDAALAETIGIDELIDSSTHEVTERDS
jgi:hypothetical protein